MLSVSLVGLGVVSLLGLVIGGLALVVDVGNVARVSVNVVVDSLPPAVGKIDVVGSLGLVAVPLLIRAKVDGVAVVVVLHAVLVGVLGGAVLLLVVALAVAAAAALGEGAGSEGSEEDEVLEMREFLLVLSFLMPYS